MKISGLNWYLEASRTSVVGYLLFMAFLCSLGFWQLDRAEQKKLILLQQQSQQDLSDVNLNSTEVIEFNDLFYRKAFAMGHYDKTHQFLLDNQIVDGKNGYFVLTPFFLDAQQRAVLVNRGWVALGDDRGKLPAIEIQTQPAHINGRIHAFPGVGFKLKGAEIPTDNWPSVVQVINNEVLGKKLGYELLPFLIQLESASEEGYKREWKSNPIITPEKHVGYAVQWFALALTLTALFIRISFKKQ